MNTQQKTIVVDNNYLSLQGLCTIVEQQPSLSLLSSLDSLSLLKDKIKQYVPDILIIKINHSVDLDLQLISELNVNTKLLILTDVDQNQAVKSLWNLKPNSLLTTNCSQTEIIEALSKVVHNDNFYCNRILECINQTGHTKIAEQHGLSIRELDVLQLVAKGKSTSDIADQLFVSKHTINSHRKNILKKLGLKSPVELIVYAIENKLT